MASPAGDFLSKDLLRKLHQPLVGTLEVVLVAFMLIITSRYWTISEHVVYISILAASALIALTRGVRGPFSVRRFLPLFAFALFIGWSILSSSWSPSFHLSLGRVATFGLVAAIGVAIGFALEPRSVAIGFVLGVVFVVAHASLVSGWHPLGAFLPFREAYFSSHGPGLFTNISDLTYLLGLGLISSTLLSLKNRLSTAVAAPAISLFFLSALGTPVLTMFFAVLGATVVGLMVFHLRYANDRLRRILRFAYPAAVFLGAVVFWLFRGPILRPLGEDPDLSGRTIIWDWYFKAFLWEPIIGIGWGNTYNWPLTPGDIYPTGGYFIAHNGFIDIGLVTGGVGVVLIVATLVLVFLRGSSIVIDRSKSLSFLFIPTLVTYIVLNDIMATSLPRYIGIFLVGTIVGLVVSENTKAELKLSLNSTGEAAAALRV